MYPNGAGHATGNNLSLYLLSASNETQYVQAKLRVLDQIRFTHLEKQGQCFHSTSPLLLILPDDLDLMSINF